MQIDGKTKLIGLIGCPVEHTLSPIIHNTLNEACKENMVYTPFHVEPDAVSDAVKGAYALGILGLNVTVPHKQAVMDSLVDMDAAAKAIGAVNTLVRVEGGYKGYNTDMEGLRREVLSENVSLKGCSVVVLGAGGASKAVVYMCLLEGAKKVYLLNRTVEKAQRIADDMNPLFDGEVIAMPLSSYGQIPDQELYAFQATSIGLHPHESDVVIEDMSFYQKVKVGFDLIYNPARTRFMQFVEQAGGTAYNGLKMLLYQGVIAYSYWTGIPMDRLEPLCDKIYGRLYKNIHHHRNIVLIGFMGSGKSTVGKALAQEMGAEFVDTDAWIEEQAGMTISEIFAQYGEMYFREFETKVIHQLLDTDGKQVVATGGGMPLRKENAALLQMLGDVVYLDISASEVYHRLQGDTTRPLLTGDNPKQKIQELQNIRRPVYQQVAEVVVSVDGRTVESIEEEILHYIEA